MGTSSKCLVVANWKMHPETIGAAKRLFLETRTAAARRTRVEVVVAAPFPYLAELRTLSTGKHTLLAAQDLFWEAEGAYTGEVSAPMLKSLDVAYVLVGHSERRALGEGNADVAKKVRAALAGGLSVIVCVGERERDAQAAYLSYVEEEIRSALADVPQRLLGKVAIAYEPIWAISGGDGRGQTATPGDVHEMSIFIRRVLTSMYTRQMAEKVRILYGGSVNEENVHALIAEGVVDGFLVGGASLNARSLGAIISAVHEKQ